MFDDKDDDPTTFNKIAPEDMTNIGDTATCCICEKEEPTFGYSSLNWPMCQHCYTQLSKVPFFSGHRRGPFQRGISKTKQE